MADQNKGRTVVNLVMAEDKKNRNYDDDNELENQSLSDFTDLRKMYMTNSNFHNNDGTLYSIREEEML